MSRFWRVLLVLALAGTAAAGELDELLHQVQETRARESRIDAERTAGFLADRNQQQKLLTEAKAALAKAEADSKALRAEFSANQTRIAALDSELKKQSGDLGELFAKVREFSGTLKSDLEDSLVSAQFPGRTEALEALAKSKALPAIPQLETLWVHLLQEMAESGRVARFPGKFTDAEGIHRETEIYRIGAFSALADGKYLRYAPETAQFVEWPQQPEGEYLSLAKNLKGGQDELVEIAIDPSRGAALELAAKAPAYLAWVPKNLRTLINNGVDIAVFGVLLVASIWALAVACERWFFYRQVDFDRYANREALETELTRHLTVIGTVAANAPYVGLLGTVLGIMLTFHKMGTEKNLDVHSIMIGLSTALKATAIGLMVAIPCVVLTNMLNRRIRELVTAYEVQRES